MTAVVLAERHERVVIVTLNRPERMNALSRETIGELGRVGRELVSDESLTLVVLTGSGDKAFCAPVRISKSAQG